MLARGTHQSLSILTAGRANKRRLVLQHLFHQELSGFIVHRANAGTIKRLETKIRNINASSHSAEFKYRNSVRFFAMIDQAKNCMELKALHAKGAACLEQILKSSSTERPAEQKSAEKACDRCFAEVKEIVHRSSAIFRELARLQWVVFKFTVFAPRGDVSIRERSMRVPLFVLQVFGNTVGRTFNRMAMKMMAWVEVKD